MKCSNCGDLTNTPIIYKKFFLCNRCYNLTRLPLYTLTRLWTTQALYDPKESRYFPDAETTLESCGFKLFNHKTYFSKNISPSYREILIYRYYGNLACGRIKDYTWPRHAIECRHVICGF